MPVKEGRALKVDSEFRRKGTCSIFTGLLYIDNGIRYTKVTERRTKADYALLVDELLREHYPESEKVTQVQDNLNTHCYDSVFAGLDEP